MTHPLTRSQLTQIAEQWVGLWNSPTDWALFDRLHADDFVDYASAGRETHKAAFGQSIVDLQAAFPDIQVQVDDVVIDEERQRAAVRWSALGTNAQHYLGVGPTRRATRITGIEIIDLAHGCIVRRWGEWDITDHLRG
ncbi:MAG: ester cyclase [Burkholderiaceae bacterium]